MRVLARQLFLFKEEKIMIHHISIAAENPLNVANVLAEIWNGKVYPTPPIPGGYIMMSFDAQGTAIEIYP